MGNSFDTYSTFCRICALSELKSLSHSHQKVVKRRTWNKWRQNGYIAASIILALFYMDLPLVTHSYVINEEGTDSEWKAVGAEGQTANFGVKVNVEYPNEPTSIRSKNKALTRDSETSYFQDFEFENKYLERILASARRELKIGNTSEFHIDNHNDSEEYDNTKNVPRADFLKKVVVLQKPFHFHIPILSHNNGIYERNTNGKAKDGHSSSQKNKRKRKHRSSQDSGGKVSVFSEEGKVFKREDTIIPIVLEKDLLNQDQEQAPANLTEDPIGSQVMSNKNDIQPGETDLDHLLSQHPKLIPPVNRKRSSGTHDKHHELLDDEAHHIMGLSMISDDDEVGMTIRKRNIKTQNFSQDLIDSILNHDDDLVKYREKVLEHANALGIQPEEVFKSVVFGGPSSEEDEEIVGTQNDIYQRRLKFHQLFLDDSTEVEKYHVNEVALLDHEEKKNTEKGPFNAYMRILRRSKRGLFGWIKQKIQKIFTRNPSPSPPPPPPPPPPPRPPPPTRRGPQKKNANNPDKSSVYVQVVNQNGDSQVDLLLPTALRRSSYLKKRNSIVNQEKEEEEFEEEYEKSEEREPGPKDDENIDWGTPGGKDTYEEYEEHEGQVEKKRSNRVSRNKRSLIEENGLKRRRISVLSKDEISLVLEMIFNMIEYHCSNVDKAMMDALLTITQVIVEMSTLYEYIPMRRSGVDELFTQMLECSSNTESYSKWTHYQMEKRQEFSKEGFIRKGFHTAGMNLYDRPLRRTKRVRREQANYIQAALELISLSNGSFPEEFVKTHTDEEKRVDLEEVHGKTDDVDNMSDLMKVYFLVYQIISDVCFNIDNQLLYESSLVFMEEMTKIKGHGEYKKEIDTLAGHFDTRKADKLLTDCYEVGLI